jgi:hypothetical protein
VKRKLADDFITSVSRETIISSISFVELRDSILEGVKRSAKEFSRYSRKRGSTAA